MREGEELEEHEASARMMEKIQENQRSAIDSNIHNQRPLLHTRRNPDCGSLEVVRGYRDTSTPKESITLVD